MIRISQRWTCKYRRPIMAAVGVVWFSAVPAGARVMTSVDEVFVRTEATIDSLTIGQRFHVVVQFTYADSLRPIVPEKIDAGTCRLMNVAWRESEKDRRIERVADLTFIPLSVDSSVVPANAFDFVATSGDTFRVWSDEVPVPIKRIAATSTDVRPLKEQWKAPPNYWLWGAIAAAVLALAALVVWWIRRRRRRGAVVAPEIRLPPEVVALAELDRIAGLGLVARGEFKTHYTLVVDAVRHYLERRYGIEAMDSTTFEIQDALERLRIRIDGLGALLDEADLVKFAKFLPDAKSATAAIDRARDMVIATTPTPAVAGE
jgi:hypothetical protein